MAQIPFYHGPRGFGDPFSRVLHCGGVPSQWLPGPFHERRNKPWTTSPRPLALRGAAVAASAPCRSENRGEGLLLSMSGPVRALADPRICPRRQGAPTRRAGLKPQGLLSCVLPIPTCASPSNHSVCPRI